MLNLGPSLLLLNFKVTSMKKSIYYLSGLVSLFCLLCFSCNREQDETLEKGEQEASVAKTRVALSEEEIKEAMEWWKHRDGTFAGPYEYYAEVQSLPYEENRNLGLEYPGYLNIRWNYNFPVCNNPWDYLMQIEYKRYSQPMDFNPNYGWKYLGEEGPAKYYYGIVRFSAEQKPLSLNAAHFPYGSIIVRYRFIHKDFPGPIIDPGATNKYDINLASKWQKEYNFWVLDNPYGFGNPNKEDEKEPEAGLTSVIVRVEFPFHSFSDKTYTYSYEIYNVADEFIEHFGGSVNSMNIGTSKITKKKNAIFGYFEISATRTNNETHECSYVHRTGQYNQGQTHVTIVFSEDDFR